MDFIVILRLLVPVLSGITAIMVAVLDYNCRDKRTKRFRRIRCVLFILLGIFLIANIPLVLKDEQSKHQERKQWTERYDGLIKLYLEVEEEARNRYLELIKKAEMLQLKIDSLMIKSSIKPIDISDKKEVNYLTKELDTLKAEIQKQLVYPIYIDVNPNRAGALIFVNDSFKGAAPCSIFVEPGVHKLKVIYTDRVTGRKWEYQSPIILPGTESIRIKHNDFSRIKSGE